MNSNAGGRNKKKQRAAKGGSGRFVNKLRYAEEGEMYACVEKMVGNGRVLVVCTDGKQYSCVIRQKFKGRHKRGNMMVAGTWCLVGVREWETRQNSLAVCDLLHVYQDADVASLKQRTTTDLTAILRTEDEVKAINHSEKMDDNVVFVDERAVNDADVQSIIETTDNTTVQPTDPIIGADSGFEFDDI